MSYVEKIIYQARLLINQDCFETDFLLNLDLQIEYICYSKINKNHSLANRKNVTEEAKL